MHKTVVVLIVKSIAHAFKSCADLHLHKNIIAEISSYSKVITISYNYITCLNKCDLAQLHKY